MVSPSLIYILVHMIHNNEWTRDQPWGGGNLVGMLDTDWSMRDQPGGGGSTLGIDSAHERSAPADVGHAVCS
jgi:hypothetical protein